jgi:ribosomal protein S13
VRSLAGCAARDDKPWKISLQALTGVGKNVTDLIYRTAGIETIP